MKSASPALVTLLNDRKTFVMADLLTISLRGGSTVTLTDADIALTWNSTVYNRAILFKRGNTGTKLGVEVDTLGLTMYGDLSSTIQGQAVIPFAATGGFDGARIKLERAFMPAWGQAITGVVHLFSGRVSDVDASRTECRIKVKSDLEILNIKMPRTLYQPSCSNVLYDSMCGASKAAFTLTGMVQSVTSKTDFVISTSQPVGWFDQGVITFTSGANAGFGRTIKSYDLNRRVQLFNNLPAMPQVGDSITIYPGCNKTMNACRDKFANLPRFRGFPFVPITESAI